MENISSIIYKIDTTTYIFTGIVLIAAIGSYIYVLRQKNNNRLIARRRWIEQIPSFVSTMGVLGTFGGITIALLDFDSYADALM